MKTLPVLALSMIFFASCGQHSNPEKQAKKDSIQAMRKSMEHIPSTSVNFLTNTAANNLKQITLGGLAKRKALDKRIQQYAEMMTKNSTAANIQLDDIAEETGVTMPKGLTESDSKSIQRLTATKQRDFDKAYIKEMIAGHKKALAEFDNAKRSDDSTISNFASGMIPALNKDLDEALTILEDIRKQTN